METVKKVGRPRRNPDIPLPNRIRHYRELNNMSINELADFLGVSITTVTNAELYGRSLGSNDWDRIADLFDIDPRVLKGKKNP